MNDKDNTEKYWKDFRVQALMVVEYEIAAKACTDFINQYARATTEDVDENADGIRVVAQLIRKFEAAEDYDFMCQACSISERIGDSRGSV